MLEKLDQRLKEVVKLIEETSELVNETGGNGDSYFNKNIKDYEKYLKEEPVRIAVVGEWNNGKSTLINSLLGEKIASEGRKETTGTISFYRYSDTSSITVIRNVYDESEKVELYKENISSKELSGLLEQYTVQNFKEHDLIDKIEICWPYDDSLDKQVILVDTPGVNGLSEMRTDMTLDYIKKCEAVIIVLDTEKVGTKSDMDFIKMIHNEEIDKIFFLLNKIDQFNHDEIEQAVVELKDKLLENEISQNPAIIPVSAAAAFYGNYLKKGGSLSEIKLPPSLRTVEVNEEVISCNSQEYPEALTCFSNIRIVKETLSDFFDRGIGLGIKISKPIGFLQRTIEEEILSSLNDKKNNIENDKSLSDIEAQILLFETRQADYELEEKQLKLRIEKSILDIKKVWTDKIKEALSKTDALKRTIHYEIKERPFEELKEKLNEIIYSILKQAYSPLLPELLEELQKLIIEASDDLATLLNEVTKDFHNVPHNVLSDSIFKAVNLSISMESEKIAGDVVRAGAAGGATAMGMLFVGTCIATTGSSGLIFSTPAFLPALASNPLGWAILAAGGVTLISYKICRAKAEKNDRETMYNQIINQKIFEKAIETIRIQGEYNINSSLNAMISTITNELESKKAQVRRILHERREFKKLKETELESKRTIITKQIERARAIENRISELQKEAREAGYVR